MFKAHEAIMRTIVATACSQIVQHLFVRQAGTFFSDQFMLLRKNLYLVMYVRNFRT